MRLLKVLTISIFLILPDFARAGLCLVDEIDFVVCGPACNTPYPKTYSDWKRTLEDKFIPKDKQIQSEIIMQQVATEKMPMDPEAIAKYVEGVKKQLKVNDAEFEALFGEVGRTMMEGLEWFAHQYTTEFFTHYKFKSQLVPTDDEIAEYFNENPEFVDEFYEIQLAKVPYTQNNREEIKDKIEAFLLNQEANKNLVSWGKTIKICADDLLAEQQFVTNMQPDHVVIQENPGSFELIKLLSYEPTRIKTLKERQNAIIETLNRKKLESMLKTYNESVKNLVDIISFDNDGDFKDQIVGEA